MKRIHTILLITSFLCLSIARAQDELTIAYTSNQKNVVANHTDASYGSAAAIIESLYQSRRKGKVILGHSANDLPVEAYFFPGTSDKKAVVISGVHGSELSAIDVAKMIMLQLEGGRQPYYNVVVVPNLFPANAGKAFLFNDPKTVTGRYTSDDHADPNRQMPSIGKSFDAAYPYDANGRLIENENIYLLNLLQSFKPSRIVSLHAIKEVKQAGIFADPRTDCNGTALGFGTDSSLAISMAQFIGANGGRVEGNKLDVNATALYYKDPSIAPAGFLQKRNLVGSKLNDNRGSGASLGGWASTAVCDDKAPREAMRILTIEFPGYQSYGQRYDESGKEEQLLNIYLYASAVTGIFLEERWVE